MSDEQGSNTAVSGMTGDPQVNNANPDTHQAVLQQMAASVSDSAVNEALANPAPTTVTDKLDTLHDRFTRLTAEFEARVGQIEHVLGLSAPIVDEVGAIVSRAMPGASPMLAGIGQIVSVLRDTLTGLHASFGDRAGTPHPTVLDKPLPASMT